VAKTPPLDAPTLAWARAQFARYYAEASVPAPEHLERRELALFPFAETTMMRRHTAVRLPAELGRFLAIEVPRHVYYSSAYYRRPEAPTMAAKEWLGADLIFDLDADHLRGAERLDYPGQLTLVRQRLIDLVDDFLVRDFGVDPATTAFVFSGGRGYHVHVRDERFTHLSSPERRELVDYVLGTGVDPMRAVEKRSMDVRSGRTVADADADEPAAGRRGGAAARSLRLAPADAPGWRGRTTRSVLAVLDRWEGAGVDVAAQELAAWGAPAPKARRWARLLVKEEWARQIRETQALDVFGTESPEAFLEVVLRHAAVEVQGETDAPVTTDIHRLIRLPGSLHGGTGFRVVPLDRDAIDRFDPFADALLPTGSEGRTPVEYLADVRYPFPDGGIQAHVGSTDELPTPWALFLLLRAEAALRPSP
jgi:DNA primase small subunit